MSGVAPTSPPRRPISEVLNKLRACAWVESRSFISLLSDNPDLATRFHDLPQELNSRSSEVPEKIRRQVDALQTLFGQGLNALTRRIQVLEKLTAAKGWMRKIRWLNSLFWPRPKNFTLLSPLAKQRL